MSDRGFIPTGLTRRKDDSPWPAAPFSAVPDIEGAATLAAAVRGRALGESRRDAPLDDFRSVTGETVRISTRRLTAASGGDEAMLLVRPGGFDILVDPEPKGGWQDDRTTDTERHRFRFRVAHELAHTVFYDRRWETPRRRLGDSERQEAFADAFARALLVPPTAARAVAATPSGVVYLQRRFDVSLEVAARALAAAHTETAGVALFYWKAGDAMCPEHAQLQWTSLPETILGDAEFARLLDPAAHDHAGADGVETPHGRALLLRLRRQLLYVASPSAARAAIAS